MKKRILATLLSLRMVMSLLPVTALAAEAQTFTVQNEEELVAAINNATGTAEQPTLIEIGSDFEISNAIHIPSGKFIKINGNNHEISRNVNSSNFTSESKLTLSTHTMFFIEGNTIVSNLTIDAKGDATHCLRGVVVKATTVDFRECTIKGAYTVSSAGGGLAVVSGTVNMYGGQISENTAKTGAAALGDAGGTVNIHNTIVSDNTGMDNGGHTFYGSSNSKLNIDGGVVSNNRGANDKACICNYPDFASSI